MDPRIVNFVVLWTIVASHFRYINLINKVAMVTNFIQTMLGQNNYRPAGATDCNVGRNVCMSNVHPLLVHSLKMYGCYVWKLNL